MSLPLASNIEFLTVDNENYRDVIATGAYMQVVLMSIPPGVKVPPTPEDGWDGEVHHFADQFIRVEEGKGALRTPLQVVYLYKDIAVFVPAGTRHEILNLSEISPLKLYTLYASPQHERNLIEKTQRP